MEAYEATTTTMEGMVHCQRCQDTASISNVLFFKLHGM